MVGSPGKEACWGGLPSRTTVTVLSPGEAGVLQGDAGHSVPGGPQAARRRGV